MNAYHHLRQFSLLILLLFLGLGLFTACNPQTARLKQDQILDITWEALKPNTSSQNRGNWEVVDVTRVYGRDVVAEFSSIPISNCPGPKPPENQAIRSSSEYWFVRAIPKPWLDPTVAAPKSSTIESIMPEPLFREAYFLIDPFTGQIVARKFVCSKEK
jgi:hypothetical protein